MKTQNTNKVSEAGQGLLVFIAIIAVLAIGLIMASAPILDKFMLAYLP